METKITRGVMVSGLALLLAGCPDSFEADGGPRDGAPQLDGSRPDGPRPDGPRPDGPVLTPAVAHVTKKPVDPWGD